MTFRPIVLATALLLTGCDLESLLADPKVAQREADARAIGSACRHGLRGIEDCYAMNPKASKASIFAGWKDMDQYMRDNKIEGVAPKGLGAAPEEVIEEPSKPRKEASAPDTKEKPTAKPKAKPKDEAAH